MKDTSVALVVATALAVSSCFAQMGGGPPGVDPSFAKFFGDHNAFSANAHFSVTNPDTKQSMVMDVVWSMSGSKIRMEMDMTEAANKMQPNAGAQMKAMGLDKITIISLPDSKRVLQVYPRLHGYLESAMAETQAAEAVKNYKTEKTNQGKETIDGHSCEKNKVTLTDDKGEKKDALVWNASDLKDFPLRVQVTEHGSTLTIDYKDVKLDKPDASLFEAPAGFTKYETQMDLMQSVMLKQRPGAGGQK
jgi:outer membrane lipoprotein-sorting protein